MITEEDFTRAIMYDKDKEIKCEDCRAFDRFFATSLINSIMQEHEYYFLQFSSYDIEITFTKHFGMKHP